MSNSESLGCILAFYDIRERTVASCLVNIRVDSPDQVMAILAAMQDRQVLEIAARDVRWFDREFRIDGRNAAQYRKIEEYGAG